MKILIVEDEELAVKKLQKTLQSLGEDMDIVGTTDSIASTGPLAAIKSCTGIDPDGH
jgi:DNA-binding LytR/AlgR family response regulator